MPQTAEKLPTPDPARNDKASIGEQAENILLAREMIALGAKASLVLLLIPLEKATVLRLYRETTGKSSPSGPSSFNGAWMQRSFHRMVQATFVWQMYTKLTASPMTEPRKIIVIFQIYRQYFPQPQLNINHVADAIRLMKANVWRCDWCDECHTWNLVSRSKLDVRCPSCSLIATCHCTACGDMMAPTTNGRKITRCAACRKAGRYRHRRRSDTP